jgi:membrane AbrB-like protein
MPGLVKWVLALLIGAAGGLIFHVLNMPLAWMLGPMTFNAVAALSRLPVAVPRRVRMPWQALLGIYIGSAFSPETAARVGDWPWSIAALWVFTLLATGLVTVYYRCLVGFDAPTALFSATPGALSAVVILGGAMGGDERRIALAQSLRITLVVVLIPMLVSVFEHQPPAPAEAELPAVVDGSTWLEFGLLIGGSTVSVLLLRRLRLPGAEIIGSLLVSAGLYVSGVVAVELPQPLLQLTLLVIGASVGARFAGVKLKELVTIGRFVPGAVALGLGLAAAFAAGISAMLEDVSYLAALLALAPGGVAEMCLIATAFDIDPVFVAAHHLARLMLLVALMPVLGWLSRPNRRIGGQAPQRGESEAKTRN